MLYGWTLNNGSKESRIVMSKAKLSAVLEKGESYRNELNGAVLNVRLKEWIFKNSDITFGQYFPFLDNQ